MDLKIDLPPHCRIMTVAFNETKSTCHVTLEGGSTTGIDAKSIVSLHGARIRQEMVTLVARASPVLFPFTVEPALVGAGYTHPHGDSIVESLVYAMAMRVDDVAESWYLIADSFNFRTTLGSSATDVTETNFRTLVKKVVSFAPNAFHDEFVDAIVGLMPLPQPVDSILEFLRIVARPLKGRPRPE